MTRLGCLWVLVICLFASFVTLAVAADDNDNAKRELPKSIDLRPDFERFGLKQRSQGRRGTCSVFATIEAVEFEIARLDGHGEPLSVEYANWAANEVTRRRDDGDFFHNIIRGIEKHGLCQEAAMPYQVKFDKELAPSEEVKSLAEASRANVKLEFHWIKDWQQKPGLSDADLQKVKETLAAGHPVSAGSHHSILFVGYEEDAALPGGGRLFIADSNRREKEISFQGAKERFCDMFWVEAKPATNARAKEEAK